jgi:hypothetical protein
LVELPGVTGTHLGRPCVSPARRLTGVAASDLWRCLAFFVFFLNLAQRLALRLVYLALRRPLASRLLFACLAPVAVLVVLVVLP